MSTLVSYPWTVLPLLPHWNRVHGWEVSPGSALATVPPSFLFRRSCLVKRQKSGKNQKHLIRMGRRLFLSISFSVPLPCYVLMNPKTLTTIFSLSKEIFVQKIHLGFSLLFLGSDWGFKTESVIFLLHNIRDWRLLSLQTETMHILYIKIFCQTCPEKCWFWSIMTKSYHFQ